MRDIERYLSIRQAYGPSIRRDGDEIAFLLDTTGVPQVWTLADRMGWPTQRTFDDDRVVFCTYAPNRPTLLFGRDSGGNERIQYFRLEPDTGAPIPVTDMPDAKHYWGGWAHEDDRFAFASNRRDEGVFDIYLQDIDAVGNAAQRVYESEGWLTANGFDPADSRLLLSEAHASFDQDLYVLDINTGERTHLTPHEGNVRFGSPQWGPDGTGIYCLSDFERDTRALVRIDVATGDAHTLVSDDEWNIDGLWIDQQSSRIGYSRNIDGYTELTTGVLTNPTTIEHDPTVALPAGVAGGVDFDPDRSRAALTISTRDQNANVHVLDLDSGSLTQWTAAATAGIPQSTFRTPNLVRIESFDGVSIPGFFTLPANPALGATPVIVDIHGGPESQRRPSFRGLAQYFLSNGYALFEPNVRGSSGYGKTYTHLDDVEQRLDSVADIAACVEWLGGQQAIDPDRIVAMGGSYGGFMVLAAMTEYPDLWAAGIDIVGIANFVTFLENTGSWRRSHREAEYGSLEDDRDFLESISPINTIDRIRAPLFIIHGENDPRVPVGEAQQIGEAAAEHVPVETVIFPDEGHGIAKRENRITAYSQVVEFLDRHV